MEGRKVRSWEGEKLGKTTDLSFKARVFLYYLCIVMVSFAIMGCQKKEQTPLGQQRLQVITTLFPVYDFTRNVAGDKANVTLLLPPGVEAHSFEPKPGDILRISSAGLLIYTGKYMEPWIENILKGVDSKNFLIVDASRGITLLESGSDMDDEGHKEKHGHGKLDPHIWLDITNAQKMVDNILEGLSRKDPANSDYYTKNAQVYRAKLDEIDKKYREVLSSCRQKVFIHGGHFAFGYLAKSYDLHYMAAYKGSPDAEPTPRRITELKKMLKTYDIKYIYYEELITPRVAEVVSKETGAVLLKIHGAHNVSKEEMDKGITFLSIMEDNLKSLQKGLGCL